MIKRGDIYIADLDPGIGSEQQGIRPIVIIQNDTGNKYSPTTIVAMITSKRKKRMTTHVYVKADGSRLTEDSIVMLEQIRTIDKRRLGEMIGHINEETMKKIDDAVLRSLGIKH